MNGGELLIILVIALVLVGPSRLPEYAAMLGRFVRQARGYAEGAKAQLREEMGPEFDDVDWKSLDPRQYDPRRIVRDALAEPLESPSQPAKSQALAGGVSAIAAARAAREAGPDIPPPFDNEAT